MPSTLVATNVGQLDLAHLDTSGFSEASFDKGLRMADHFLTFLAFNEEGTLPALQRIRNESMQAIGDQKVLFSTHHLSLIVGLLTTGVPRQSRAHRWR